MTADDAGGIEGVMAVLSLRAARRNRERAQRLERLCADLGPETPERAWADAAEMAHQIAGSSGTFGNAAASETARSLLVALRSRDLTALADHVDTLTALLAGPERQ
ncbi:Hpt domain-containing protein [Georgenia daeguensis]|uniref:HPt domain-containing protein n=1 Tax=Georgenia daeguensis TaxID=908355 RepID=A0ABP6UPJ0_9MICO